MNNKEMGINSELEKMGLSLKKNNYSDRIGKLHRDYFDADETLEDINIYRRTEFLSRRIYGKGLTFVIENTPKFNTYWGLGEEGIPDEFGGFVELCHLGHPSGYIFEFNFNECIEKVKTRDKKVEKLLNKKIEGYKLIRLFKDDVEREAFQQMRIEIEQKSFDIVNQEFNKEMDAIVFEEIFNSVER